MTNRSRMGLFWQAISDNIAAMSTATTSTAPNTGPLAGLRVLDLTRILAGPGATQALGDMGAEVIKIEKPGAGDDTRGWGPPFLQDAAGNDTSESAYYLCANRNKKSVSIDISKPEGLALVKKLLATCDVLVENYKTGGLAKYGLAYDQLKDEFPRLVYCSLTGFGHTGPYAHHAGYDFAVQAMGGIMSLTGPVDGAPYKMAVAYTDVMTGQNALAGILAALYHREKTGLGQHIDIALLDTQVAALWNVGQNYLTSGQAPRRMGNTHPSIVPYEAFEAKDGWLVLAVGNDRQFHSFCAFAKRPELAADPRFARNADRVRHRDTLAPLLHAIIAGESVAHWVEGLDALDVPCGPVNSVPQVFADPQVQARGGIAEMRHPLSDAPIRLLANPLKFSRTPVSYRHAPPLLGEHTQEVLGLDDAATQDLKAKGVI